MQALSFPFFVMGSPVYSHSTRAGHGILPNGCFFIEWYYGSYLLARHLLVL